MASRSQKRAQYPSLGPDPTFRHKLDRSGAPKYTDAGNPQVGLAWSTRGLDFGDSATALAAASNYDLAIRSASRSARRSGQEWYPRVHDAIDKSLYRHSNFLSAQTNRQLAGAGLVAAVSPNMDWERNNIDALDEMANMSSGQWDAVMHGSAQDHADAVRGLSASAASRGAWQKAGRIVAGEDPTSVLNVQSGPKTHNFMQNIYDPDNAAHATVDGRAFDTLVNRALPWEQGRGIQKAANVTGKPTRYEQAQQIISNVSQQHGLSPSAGQAVAWEAVKQDIEKLGGTRKQGPARLGQPIFDPHSGVPVMHDVAAQQQRKSSAIQRFVA